MAQGEEQVKVYGVGFGGLKGGSFKTEYFSLR